MEDTNTYQILNDPEMKEIVESFQIETKEIIDKLDVDLMELEKTPEDTDLLNQVFRSFHTIKGTGGFLGLEKLTQITHKCEDILNKLRKKEIRLNSVIMDGILYAFDIIKNLLTSIEQEKRENLEIRDALQKLDGFFLLSENKPELPYVSPIEKNETAEKNDKKKQTAEKTIRVDVERLDELLNIASELVLGRNRLSQVNSEFGLEYEGSHYSRELSEAAKLIDLMTNELQLVVMKTRMVKIGKIFNKYPRLVRDLSKESNKEIDLVIEGEETELDKTLIEEINDPLVHLIRNSVDHGVEDPETRGIKGKSRRGRVILSAKQEGNNIVISIEDDGNGIDPEFIKNKAIQKNLITKDRAKELSRAEALNLIFLPGFSTAEKVTNISGRGVGMDVVKTNIAKLRGIINIESIAGEGTKIIIKLPLTLAIIPGMIVSIKEEQMIIPLNSVIEAVRVKTSDIHTVNQKEIINIRDNVIPVISLDHLTKNKASKDAKNVWQYIVLVAIAEKKFGIKVDKLIGQKEVVIKSMGAYLGNIHGIAGSTIMGDGKVVMILDMNELISQAA